MCTAHKLDLYVQIEIFIFLIIQEFESPANQIFKKKMHFPPAWVICIGIWISDIRLEKNTFS